MLSTVLCLLCSLCLSGKEVADGGGLRLDRRDAGAAERGAARHAVGERDGGVNVLAEPLAVLPEQCERQLFEYGGMLDAVGHELTGDLIGRTEGQPLFRQVVREIGRVQEAALRRAVHIAGAGLHRGDHRREHTQAHFYGVHAVEHGLLVLLHIQGEVGPQGVQGDRGCPGPQGEQGVQGPKGENGETPVITVAEDTPRSYKLHFQSGEQELTTPRTAHRAHRRLRKFRGAPVKGPSLDSRQFSARKKAAAEHSCSGLFRFSYRVRTRPSNSHT